MSPRTSTLPAAAAAAAALLTWPLGQAHATDREDASDGQYLLTISGAHGTWIRGVRLVCPGPGGRHPHAAEACESLALAGGQPEALLGDAEQVCTREEDPVEATARGDWHGLPVAWRRTFPNLCALEAATGPVFRF
ncbi:MULTISPECIES: SSI family serine proteinase inhibitor [Streptomyces]|uniref:Subtilisin inhibitor domain-containing protein n=1 Tax=Streptomyces luteosporeus TaxID=173856 RepID=A0ABN3U4G8_9ACTN